MLMSPKDPFMCKSGHAYEEYAKKPIATGDIPHKYPDANPVASKITCARVETAMNARKSPMNLAWPIRRSTAASGMKSAHAETNAILPDACTNGKESAFNGADSAKPNFSAILALMYQKSRYVAEKRIV